MINYNITNLQVSLNLTLLIGYIIFIFAQRTYIPPAQPKENNFDQAAALYPFSEEHITFWAIVHFVPAPEAGFC